MLCPSCAADNQQDVEVCFACGRHLSALTHGSLIASRYEIVALIGKGGMGMVYRANDQLLEEVVAIKVLRNEFVGTSEMGQRFRSEIKLARKVSHPNVCRIHEYGEDGGVKYISMALVEGTDLRSYLLRYPEGLPVTEAYQLSIQTAEGLQAIHDVGIIHRDLKTPNIVLDEQNAVKLMDFGIAKESGRAGGLTATGEVMGTPEYMSPEQCRGEKIDFRSDVYALGIVIFEIFTGSVPFRGDTLMATLLKQLQELPPLDGPAAARIPPGVVRVLRKALAKSSAQRFDSAADVARALRQAQAEPLPARVSETSPTRAIQGGHDRRQHSRLDISVDVVLKKISAGGAVMQEERTVADNIGRRGARVMTAMTGLEIGDTVALQEVGSDFAPRAAVRYVHKPSDNIQRLGLEFLDRPAPDRLVPTDRDSKSRMPRLPRPGPDRGTPAPSSPGAPRTPASRAAMERRRDSRLDISVDVILKRLAPWGEVLQEERTVADNIGRRGARVMTAMQDLDAGDIISFEEVGTSFRTRAAVRSSYAGRDGIHRLGVEFLDRAAPDHLVAKDDSKSRLSFSPDRRTEAATPTGASAARSDLDAARLAERREQIREAHEGLKTRNHFEVLGIPRASNAAQVKEAYVRLTKLFHPDAQDGGLLDLKREVEAVFIRIGDSYGVLSDPGRRSQYENALGHARPTPPAVPTVHSLPTFQPFKPTAPIAKPETVEPPRERDPDSDSRLAEQVLQEARKLLAEERYWDAIQSLEGALELAKGRRINHALRILLARATGKNPKWRKRAESILLSVIDEDPAHLEAHLMLGALYRSAGLKSRASAQFKRALQIQPGNAQAVADLKSLDGPIGDPPQPL